MLSKRWQNVCLISCNSSFKQPNAQVMCQSNRLSKTVKDPLFFTTKQLVFYLSFIHISPRQT